MSRNLILKLSQILAGVTEWNRRNLWDRELVSLLDSNHMYRIAAVRYSIVCLYCWYIAMMINGDSNRSHRSYSSGYMHAIICVTRPCEGIIFPRKEWDVAPPLPQAVNYAWEVGSAFSDTRKCPRCCDVIVYPLLHCGRTMARRFYRLTRCVGYVTQHKFPQAKACPLCAAVLARIRAGFNFEYFVPNSR
jgi:hypothetical protein